MKKLDDQQKIRQLLYKHQQAGTLSELDRRLGVSRKTSYKWVNGYKPIPKKYTYKKIRSVSTGAIKTKHKSFTTKDARELLTETPIENIKDRIDFHNDRVNRVAKKYKRNKLKPKKYKKKDGTTGKKMSAADMVRKNRERMDKIGKDPDTYGDS